MNGNNTRPGDYYIAFGIILACVVFALIMSACGRQEYICTSRPDGSTSCVLQ